MCTWTYASRAVVSAAYSWGSISVNVCGAPSFPTAIVVPLAAGLSLLCGCVVALACIVSRRRKKQRGAQLAEMTPSMKVIEAKATVEAGV